jgi:tripartite ATP-independent transporter DctM subunit
VSDLYAAAFGPGVILACLYLAYLLGRSFINPKLGPPVPKEERVHSVPMMIKEVLIGVVPLLGLITATLGSILVGLATPTEASAVGALGAGLLAAAYRKLTLAGIKQALLSTTATSAMVLLLAVTSNIFGAVFARLGSANWITETLLSLPLSPTMMLIVCIVLIFLLGWPFEWPAIVLVFLPIFYPVVKALNFDMVWFGALVAVTLQTAFLSPPVAMSAYYLRQVVKEWSLGTIYKGMFEFMILQVIAISILIAFPQVATWLPEKLNAEFRAQKVERVEDNIGLDAYQQDGGYGEALSDALKDAREDEARENKEEEGAGDSLKEDEATKAGK